MENDLISRGNLLRILTTMIEIEKDSLKNAHPASTNYLRYRTRIDDFEELHNLITNVPSVNAVEVVRCGNCKHWMKDVTGCTKNVGRCEFANYFVGFNGYCVYGEGKEGADNG